MKKSELKKLIKEEIGKTLNELTPQNDNSFYKLGFEVGPNGGNADVNSKEAGVIMDKTDLPLIQLESDKDVVAFVKGYVDSVASNSVQFNGIATIAPILLKLKKKGWPESGKVL